MANMPRFSLHSFFFLGYINVWKIQPISHETRALNSPGGSLQNFTPFIKKNQPPKINIAKQNPSNDNKIYSLLIFLSN